MSSVDSIDDSKASVIMRKIDTSKDLPFIYSTWRNSLWNDHKRPETEDSSSFYSSETKRIKLLSLPDLYAWVACLSDDHDFILGYSVSIDLNLERVYVRADYRKQGIGTMLAAYFKTISPPQTKIGKAIAKKKNLRVEGFETL